MISIENKTIAAKKKCIQIKTVQKCNLNSATKIHRFTVIFLVDGFFFCYSSRAMFENIRWKKPFNICASQKNCERKKTKPNQNKTKTRTKYTEQKRKKKKWIKIRLDKKTNRFDGEFGRCAYCATLTFVLWNNHIAKNAATTIKSYPFQ